jgi:hypothetical protein
MRSLTPDHRSRWRLAKELNLPGPWFAGHENYSLVLMHSLLEQLWAGFVREQIGPFRTREREPSSPKSGVQKERRNQELPPETNPRER